MKSAALLLVMIGVLFGSMDSPSIARESKASEALSGFQGQVHVLHPSTADQRAIERFLLSIDRHCQGQDSACFERKLGTDARYRASSKA